MNCTCPTHHTDAGVQRFAADVSCPVHGRAIVQTPASAALEAVTRQRDELLAALKDCELQMTRLGLGKYEATQRARAAIAKASGGAA